MRVHLMLTAILLLAAFAGAVDVIDPSEIEAGMTGSCVTEMDGGERVEIPLTVVGVLGPSAPEREIVLVRLDDERFERTGIIAGMSGSPVYVDGRLLGALAFGWTFSKDPIGGVTPFQRMLQIGESGGDSAGGGGIRPEMGEILSAGREGRLGELVLDWLVPSPAGELQRLPLAMSMGGGHTTSPSGWLAEGWRRMGWVGAPGGVVGADAPQEPLQPGAMVAAVLVEGDALVAAGGTVTEVRGDEVWAFGHPYYGAGGVRIPLARARVLAVLASQASSFKFFEVGETIGEWRADRSHGVWGRLGAEPPMVPVRVVVNGHGYSFRVVRHPLLFPLFSAYLTQVSAGVRGRMLGDQTVPFSIELTYAGDRRLRFREVFAGDSAPLEAAGMAAAVIGFLENSSFETPDLEDVEIRVDPVERISTAVMIDAMPERQVIEPGGTLPVRIRFRPHRGEIFTRRVELQIPPHVPEGRLDLVVADGASWSAYDLQMRPLYPASFDDELSYLERVLPSQTLVLALEKRQLGVALPGGTLAVPPSVAVQLRSALGPNLETTDYGVLDLLQEEMPMSVSGAERIPLTVRLTERESS
jgi:hypothetical protein